MTTLSQRPAGRTVWASWANVILGILTIAAPFWSGESGGVMATNVVLGAIVLILAGWNVYSTSRGEPMRWVSIVNLIAGIVIAVFPFAMTTTLTLRWSNVILGILVILVSAYDVWAAGGARTRMRGRPA